MVERGSRERASALQALTAPISGRMAGACLRVPSALTVHGEHVPRESPRPNKLRSLTWAETPDPRPRIKSRCGLINVRLGFAPPFRGNEAQSDLDLVVSLAI